MNDTEGPTLVEQATDQLLERAAEIRNATDRTLFQSRQQLARLLGANHDPDTGVTRFGFWAPELAESRVADQAVALELYTPAEAVDLQVPRLCASFHRHRIRLRREGDYVFGVLAGVRAGTRERLGALYWLVAEDSAGKVHRVRDVLAHSIPYGSFAPAEVYDIESLQRRRSDLEHFAAPCRVPSSILELHVPTATESGTLGELAARYRDIADTLRRGEPLTPAQQVLADYDAIQPLPVDPTIERKGQSDTFSVIEMLDEKAGLVSVLLRHPDNQNWGYDNIVSSSSATNPSLLGSRRPDELIELAEALHAMPEPMSLIYDIVYGHADNQALEILPSRFFKGPNMYGQDLNHQDPTVRAILLEMQRRRIDTGCDGLRVDGAQDFKFYDPRAGEVAYDDDYLQSMSAVEQTIGPHRRTLWMIFEDGRPWPDEGWETRSTYRDVIEQQPDTYQWGPLIFAHNTPMLKGFWREKWWRVEEIARHGGHWISGCANHDTVRRGTQVDPAAPINEYLGDRLPDILDNAYDNAAVTLVSYGLLPGIPMDFLNATTRSPWAFMRDTDDLYGVKVMTEEGGFLDWQVDDGTWGESTNFWRTKRHGFSTRKQLRAFLAELSQLIEETDYDLETIAMRIDSPVGLDAGAEGLQSMAQDYMRDVHDFCTVARHLDDLDADRVAFAARLREFRRQQIWLRDDFRETDRIECIDGEQTVYAGVRVAPDGSSSIVCVSNMAGATFEASLRDTLSGWPEVAEWPLDEASPILVAPGARYENAQVRLPDGTGLLFHLVSAVR